MRANGSEGKVQQGLQGLGFKAWSICRKSRWLIPDFLLNKNWVGHLKIIFAERGGGGGGGGVVRGEIILTNKSSKVQTPRGLPYILKLFTDRLIIWTARNSMANA